MNELKAKLEERVKYDYSKIKWQKATNPLFENKDPTLLARIAISLGCDVLSKEIPEVGLPSN